MPNHMHGILIINTHKNTNTNTNNVGQRLAFAVTKSHPWSAVKVRSSAAEDIPVK